MKKLLFIFFIFTISLLGQTDPTITLTSAGVNVDAVDYARSNYVIYDDTVFVVWGGLGLIKSRRGMTPVWSQVSPSIDLAGEQKASPSDGATGSLFFWRDSLWNLWGGVGNCKNRKYDKGVQTNLASFNLEYGYYYNTPTPIILSDDSLLTWGNRSAYGYGSYEMYYKRSTDAWSYTSITQSGVKHEDGIPHTAITWNSNHYVAVGNWNGLVYTQTTGARLYKYNSPNNYTLIHTFDSSYAVKEMYVSDTHMYFLTLGHTGNNNQIWKWDGASTWTWIPYPATGSVNHIYLYKDNLWAASDNIGGGVTDSSCRVYIYKAGVWNLGNWMVLDVIPNVSNYIQVGQIFHDSTNKITYMAGKKDAFVQGWNQLTDEIKLTDDYFPSFIALYPFTDFLYAEEDTAWIHWDSHDSTLVDVEISISYNNGGSYTAIDTVTNTTYYAVTFSDTGRYCIIQVKDLDNALTDISETFRVVSNKFLEISSASVIYATVGSPVSKLTVAILHKAIPDVEFYTSADSITWRRFGTLTGLSLALSSDSIYQDTLLGSYPSTVYVKVVETKTDTVVYNLPSYHLNSVSMIYGLQYCTWWGNYSDGAKWVTDVSCGWVGGITLRYGQSSLYFDGDTLKSAVDFYRYDKPPYDTIPCSYPYTCLTSLKPNASTSANKTIYLGRGYWVENKKLWMTDLVNGVSYSIADLSPYSASGSSSMGDSVTVTFIGNKVIIKNITPAYPNAWGFTALDYPADISEPALQDNYKVMGGEVIVYRDYFRGIHPKILKHR